MKLKNKYTITIFCFLIGILILHPLTMVLGHLMHMANSSGLHIKTEQIFDEFIASYSFQMVPWGILSGFLCGVIGYYFESLKSQKMLLKKANDTKDKFFSIIAHDLKAPFFSLIGYSELLLNKYEDLDDKKRKKYIGIIEKSAEQTHELLENLLEWSRIQSEDIEFCPYRINIQDLTREIIALLNENATKKEISIQSSITKDTFVFGDLNMISVIIRNLLSNAIKYTKKGGSIEFSSITIEGYEKIIISDTGIGMTEEEVNKLFRIDAKSSKNGTADEKGTGLGLILCKEFLDRHKGRIDVESRVGMGTRFIVQLPKA